MSSQTVRFFSTLTLLRAYSTWIVIHPRLGFENNDLRKSLLKECVEKMTQYPEIARRVAFSATTAPAKSLCKAFRWSSPTNCDQ